MIGTATSPDGTSIASQALGEGSPALVFVHGWSCDRTYWAGQLQPFSRDFRLVAVDLGGHGESGLERDAWTIPAFGEDVAAVVEKLRLDRVVLVGHSMGGDVILEAARRLPGPRRGAGLGRHLQKPRGTQASRAASGIRGSASHQLREGGRRVRSEHVPTRYRPVSIEVVIMPGTGHFLMMEDPARFNSILRGVIDKFA
jgi:pimeloyl-ACP methyl ester carboxylesterase